MLASGMPINSANFQQVAGCWEIMAPLNDLREPAPKAGAAGKND